MTGPTTGVDMDADQALAVDLADLTELTELPGISAGQPQPCQDCAAVCRDCDGTGIDRGIRDVWCATCGGQGQVTAVIG